MNNHGWAAWCSRALQAQSSVCSLRWGALLPRRDPVPLPSLAFPNPLLENSSAQADPAVGGFGLYLLCFFQHLLGPAQHAGPFLSLADALLIAV